MHIAIGGINSQSALNKCQEPELGLISGGVSMGVATFEGVVEQGQIRLEADVRLPEKARVYVIVPDVQIERSAQIFSPRLAHPEQAADFELEVFEETSDASV
jgi:hypothetical protein